MFYYQVQKTREGAAKAVQYTASTDLQSTVGEYR